MVGFGAPEFIILLLVLGYPLYRTIATLVEILKSEFTGNNKIIWFFVVFFIPILGVTFYHYIGKKQKITDKQSTTHEKKCPYCAEKIQYEAIKCKHCGEYIEKSKVVQ